MALVKASGVEIVPMSVIWPLIITVGVPWNFGILKAASLTELM